MCRRLDELTAMRSEAAGITERERTTLLRLHESDPAEYADCPCHRFVVVREDRRKPSLARRSVDVKVNQNFKRSGCPAEGSEHPTPNCEPRSIHTQVQETERLKRPAQSASVNRTDTPSSSWHHKTSQQDTGGAEILKNAMSSSNPRSATVTR
jgi:hypothetical protein